MGGNRFEITGDLEELRELTRGIPLAEKTLKRAVVSALNKTATSGRAWLTKAVAKEYNLKQKDVRAAITISKANYTRMRAELSGTGSPGIPLVKFSPTPRRVPSTIHKEGRKVVAMGKRGKPLKRLRTVPGSDRYLPGAGIKVMVRRGRRKLVRGAFVAKMDSGHVGVFRRAGDGRWGLRGRRTVIEELYGPSPFRILEGDEFHIPFDDFIGETMDKNMAHEADFYLRREGVLPRV
jgi:hypothetical protein